MGLIKKYETDDLIGTGSMGSAVVEAAQTELLAERSPGGRRLATLVKGNRVNVLSGIKSLHDSFTLVQFISEAAISPPGFVRTSDLGQSAGGNEEQRK
jgi:hypothetical protein